MSDKNLLNIKDLYVDVEDKEILHGVNLSIGKGETHVLMGPNGTGKSTLGYAIMGNPRYTVKNGEIWFNGKNITNEPVNERYKPSDEDACKLRWLPCLDGQKGYEGDI